jgi:lauroyl/myristoyl acyltransferase
LLGRFYYNGPFWYWFPMFGVRVIPRWAIPPILASFTLVFWALLHGPRRAVDANLELVLGRAGLLGRWRRSFRTIHQFAWCLAERYQQFLPNSRISTDSELHPDWERIKDSPNGIIFVTAHVGGWEMGAGVTQDDPSTRVLHVVREREANPESAKYLESLLAGLGGPRIVVHYSADESSLGIELLGALRRGEWIALQGDRPPTGGKVVSIPFLGEDVDFPLGPALLGRLSGAHVVSIFVERLGREHYRLRMCRPIQVDQAILRDEAIKQATTAFARELEAVVRRRPYQWFCLRNIRSRR